MKRILIALDSDPLSEKVARTGHDLAIALNATTVLVHVIPEATYYSSLKYSPVLGFETFSALNAVESDQDAELVKMGKEFLEKTKQNLGNDSVVTWVKTGELDENLLELANSGKIDMIVMGSHHRKGMERIFSAHLVEKIVRQSPVPVLIVPVATEE